jgi:hypothetical protein
MNRSQDQCQERLKDCYETYQTACGPKKDRIDKQHPDMQLRLQTQVVYAFTVSMICLNKMYA